MKKTKPKDPVISGRKPNKYYLEEPKIKKAKAKRFSNKEIHERMLKIFNRNAPKEVMYYESVFSAARKSLKQELGRVAPKIKVEWVKDEHGFESKGKYLFIFNLSEKWYANFNAPYFSGLVAINYKGLSTSSSAKQAATRFVNNLYNKLKKGEV